MLSRRRIFERDYCPLTSFPRSSQSQRVALNGLGITSPPIREQLLKGFCFEVLPAFGFRKAERRRPARPYLRMKRLLMSTAEFGLGILR